MGEISQNRLLNYSGEVKFTVDIKTSTNKVYFHVDREVKIIPQPNPTIFVTKLDTNKLIYVNRSDYLPNQIFRLILAEDLTPGSQYTIEMNFTSQTTADGFYYHSYSESFTMR